MLASPSCSGEVTHSMATIIKERLGEDCAVDDTSDSCLFDSDNCWVVWDNGVTSVQCNANTVVEKAKSRLGSTLNTRRVTSMTVDHRQPEKHLTTVEEEAGERHMILDENDCFFVFGDDGELTPLCEEERGDIKAKFEEECQLDRYSMSCLYNDPYCYVVYDDRGHADVECPPH